MMTRDDVIRLERYCHKQYTDYEEHDDYIIYFNEENRQSHDSNHACLLNLRGDVTGSIDHIIGFYQAKGLIPRFYGAYIDGEFELLEPMLKDRKFTIEQYRNKYFIRDKAVRLSGLPELRVREIKEYCKDVEIIYADEPWSYKTMKRQLAGGHCRYFTGYIAEQPICCVAVNRFGKYTYLDSVQTVKAERGKGYCQSLLNTVLNDPAISDPKTQYLMAYEPDAVHIYRKLGYEELDIALESWTAWLEEKG